MERSRCEGTNFTDAGGDSNIQHEQRKNSEGKECMLQNRTCRDEQERYTNLKHFAILHISLYKAPLNLFLHIYICLTTHGRVAL